MDIILSLAYNRYLKVKKKKQNSFLLNFFFMFVFKGFVT